MLIFNTSCVIIWSPIAPAKICSRRHVHNQIGYTALPCVYSEGAKAHVNCVSRDNNNQHMVRGHGPWRKKACLKLSVSEKRCQYLTPAVLSSDFCYTYITKPAKDLNSQGVLHPMSVFTYKDPPPKYVFKPSCLEGERYFTPRNVGQHR